MSQPEAFEGAASLGFRSAWQAAANLARRANSAPMFIIRATPIAACRRCFGSAADRRDAIEPRVLARGQRERADPRAAGRRTDSGGEFQWARLCRFPGP